MNIIRLISLSLLFVLSGCELFSTRAPEDPEGSTGGWRFPASPGIVTNNLEVSIGRRSNVDYLKSFISEEVDSVYFIFNADPESAANSPGVFDGWDINSERSFIESLFGNIPLDSLSELTLTIREERPISSDAWQLSADYELHVGHLRDEAPRYMEGALDFELIRLDDGGWFISSWSDQRISGFWCWSDLKARF
ncbi:MAG: hypothetical protein HQ568_00405 [Calditrichaeota bacterium]|nr:hypothetical protein [Calditrichota bacterium]